MASQTISQGRQDATANVQRLQKRLFTLPKGDSQALAQTQAELGAWLLCLANDPDQTFLEGSIAANRAALKVLDQKPHSPAASRTRSFLAAGLLLSPLPPSDPKGQDPSARPIDLELKRLIDDANGPWNFYDSAWQPGTDIGFANAPAFKETLKQAIIVCETSFLTPKNIQHGDSIPKGKIPSRALAMATAAHFWMLMPCADKEEKNQYLQKARAACTAALAALPTDAPIEDYVSYRLMAAQCWSAGDSHRSNMITAATILEDALAQAPKLQRRLLTAFVIDRLCATLSRIDGASPQEYVMLRQKQLALEETAISMVPRNLDRQLWESSQFGIAACLCDIARMSKGPDSPALFRRGIAHLKAAVVLNPGESPLGWHDYYLKVLDKTRKSYEEAGLDKDVPFDSIEPAQ